MTKSKTIAQLDDQGFFTGAVRADESPLEPGVYLIPRNAVNVPAPVVPAGQRAKWVGGVWAFEALPPPPADPTPPPPTPTALRIVELKSLLRESDFKILPDYDKSNTTIRAQRQQWRNELRTLAPNDES